MVFLPAFNLPLAVSVYGVKARLGEFVRKVAMAVEPLFR